MKHVRLLGLAQMAIFALGVVAAATASAAAPGLLFLPWEKAPVKVSGSSTTAEPTLTVGTDTVKCKTIEFKGELGKDKSEAEHAILGALEVNYTGCEEPLKKAKCSSENAKGEKVAGTITQVTAGTDLHTVALLSGSTLVPGLLVGLLSVEGIPLTINCTLVKVAVLGATLLEVKGASLTADVETVELEPTTLPCDTSDELCSTLFKSWGASNAKKELCPLAGVLTTEEICGTFKTKPIKIKFSQKVLIDY